MYSLLTNIYPLPEFRWVVITPAYSLLIEIISCTNIQHGRIIMLKAFKHQTDTTDFILANPRVLITSDPGTGKTRGADAYTQRCAGCMLVLAPLSILS